MAITPVQICIGTNLVLAYDVNDISITDTTKSGFPLKLGVGYIDPDKVVTRDISFPNARTIVIKGLPLVTSMYSNFFTLYSAHQYTWAINVIINTDPTLSTFDSDQVDPSLELRTALSSTLQGNRLSISKDSNNRYYLNTIITNSINLPDPSDPSIITNDIRYYIPAAMTTWYGFQLGLGPNKELLIKNTGYTMDQIEEYQEIFLDTMPLNVGRIGSNWYLIIAGI